MTMLRTGSDGSCAALDGDVDIERDRALVLLAQNGDRSAFDELYALYHRRLWRFCHKRLQDDHEAEDVVQEAFLRAWRALPGFGGDRRFYPWLSVIAAHLCTNVVRKRNRADPAGDLTDREAISWEHCGEDHVIAAHDSELASRALARLSPRHRLVLDLRESRGWSYRRIAEHEGIGIPAVESLLWRAREALKREFSAQDGEGRLTGFAGAALFTIRRWLRTPQVALQQGAGFFPTTSSVIMSSAAAAVTAVAVGVGTLVPNLGSAAEGSTVAASPGVPSLSAAFSPLWSLAFADSPLVPTGGSKAWGAAPGTNTGSASSGSGAGTPDAWEIGASSPPPSTPPVAPTVNVDPQLPSAPEPPQAPSPTMPTPTPMLPQAPAIADPTVSSPLPSPSAPTPAQMTSLSGTADLPTSSSLPSTSSLPSGSTAVTGSVTGAVSSIG
jgi:RNA polymerase sigma-70 factor (ECF subfamily)